MNIIKNISIELISLTKSKNIDESCNNMYLSIKKASNNKYIPMLNIHLYDTDIKNSFLLLIKSKNQKKYDGAIGGLYFLKTGNKMKKLLGLTKYKNVYQIHSVETTIRGIGIANILMNYIFVLQKLLNINLIWLFTEKYNIIANNLYSKNMTLINNNKEFKDFINYFKEQDFQKKIYEFEKIVYNDPRNKNVTQRSMNDCKPMFYIKK
jgi:hypothetical protein